MTVATTASRLSLVCALAAVVFLGAASRPGVTPTALADGGETCAGVPDGSTQTTPSPGAPCWVGVDPYPFGADGTFIVGPWAPS